MQTFFAFSSFNKNARMLDGPRLGKQRLEAYQILEHLLGVPGRENFYPHHPIMPMWDGYEYALCVYGMEMCTEFKRRGAKDDMFWKFSRYGQIFQEQGFSLEFPPWWRDIALMRSHRSNLFRKDAAHYYAFRRQGAMMPYLWPYPTGEGTYELRISAADRKRLAAGEKRLPDDLTERVVNL